MEEADCYHEPLGIADFAFCSDSLYQESPHYQDGDITDCFANLHCRYNVHQESASIPLMMPFTVQDMTSTITSSTSPSMMPALTAMSSTAASSMTLSMSSPMNAATTPIMEQSTNGTALWGPQAWDGSETTNVEIEGTSNVDYNGRCYQQTLPPCTAIDNHNLGFNSGFHMPEPKGTCPSPTMASPPGTTKSSVSVTSPRLYTKGGGKELSEDVLLNMWLNQQHLGPSVKRKRNINPRQRLAANFRERRRMSSLNSAFEDLRNTIPTHPFEKKFSRIQTLRFAMDYISFMSDML